MSTTTTQPTNPACQSILAKNARRAAWSSSARLSWQSCVAIWW
ncbi:MAG: hypothetical protein ACJ788_03855 [Ktedonobacteraceae bacterium]